MYYLITWKDWKTNEMMSLRVSVDYVSRFIQILVKDVKPNEIHITIVS